MYLHVINLSREQYKTEIATAQGPYQPQNLEVLFLIVRLEQNSEKDTSSKPGSKIGYGLVITRQMIQPYASTAHALSITFSLPHHYLTRCCIWAMPVACFSKLQRNSNHATLSSMLSGGYHLNFKHSRQVSTVNTGLEGFMFSIKQCIYMTAWFRRLESIFS